MLASIQRITALEPIEGRDRVVLAHILGWTVMVRKDEFKVGDLCVYCEIDTVLPDKPEFAFLKDKNFRIKTQRYKAGNGAIFSQGIAFPIEAVLPAGISYHEGQDVTEILGVKHYEKEIPAQLHGQVKGAFPAFLKKTDEVMVQSVPGVLEEIVGIPLYITTKIDGTSCTIYKRGDSTGVCSRNLELKETEGNVYWEVARKYRVLEGLSNLSCDLAIQCEVAGPGIQKNKLGLTERTLFLFNVFDISTGRYLDYEDVIRISLTLLVPTVPVETTNFVFDHAPTMEELLQMAVGSYPNGSPKEGIVVRPMKETYSPTLRGRLSFKVMNNEFLARYGE